MVDHRSTGMPECGPIESSAPEPCLSYFLFKIYWTNLDCLEMEKMQGKSVMSIIVNFYLLISIELNVYYFLLFMMYRVDGVK